MTGGARQRVAPGTRAEVGTLTWLFTRLTGLVAGTEPPNLFRTLGKHPRLFRSWLRFAAHLMPFGCLPRRETELVILRVALLSGSRYEFDQHRRLARRAGVRTENVVRLELGRQSRARHEWSPRERAVLRATDCLHRDHDLDDDTFRELREHLTERECIELCMLVGHYEMLATTIAALRIAPDEPERTGSRRQHGTPDRAP